MMRTKGRYMVLFGVVAVFICFYYLHSDNNNKQSAPIRSRLVNRIDPAWKRKLENDQDVFYHHERDNKDWDDFHDQKEDALENEEDEEEESADEPSIDEKERTKNNNDEETLPRPDKHVDDEPARAQKPKVPNDKPAKLKFNESPIDDPIMRFDWGQKNRGKQFVAPVLSQTCSPKVNITFLKVHKTGSSTVQNIFLRYGDQHALTFVLPMYGHHLGYPNFFEKKHMLKVKNGIYNLFCHHSRFSNDVREVMPANSVYISILRDPVKVFESAFTYFKLDSRVNMAGDKDAMKKFVSNPRKYYRDMGNAVHSRNGMLYDFGVPATEFDDLTFINRAIRMINDQFHLVMIAEYFEESLILMKELLCWRMEDVIVFRQNSRSADSILDIDSAMRNKIQSWNSGDMLLYNYFNKTLWEKIERYGHERMAKDIELLKMKTKSLYDRCIATDTATREQGDFKVWQPPGVKINAFKLKPSARGNRLCEQMVKPEIQYTMELKIKQFPEINFARMRQKRVPSQDLKPQGKVHV